MVLLTSRPPGTETEPRFCYENSTVSTLGTAKKLYAINADGSKKWEFVMGDGTDSTLSIGSDGTIYFGSDDKKLYAIGAGK